MQREWTASHGHWLKRELARCEYNQVEAAKRIKVSRPTLSRWINGHSSPLTPRNIVSLGRLLRLLGYASSDEFLSDANLGALAPPDEPSLSSTARDVLDLVALRGALDFTEMPPQNQRSFLDGLQECRTLGLLTVRKVGLRQVAYTPNYAILAELSANSVGSPSQLAARLRLPETSIRLNLATIGIRSFYQRRLTLPPRSYKTIIFDWSNTLVNETNFDDELCDFLSEGRRDLLRLHLDHLQSTRDWSWYDYRHLAEFCGKSWADVVAFHRNRDNAELMTWIESANYFIRCCNRHNTPCALATNCVRPILDLRFEMLKFDPNSFFCIVTGDQTMEIRSKRQHYRMVLDQLGVSPKDVLVIGDNLECDVLPAIKLGMDAAWFYFKTPLSFWGSPSAPSHPDDLRLLESTLKPTFIAVDHRETIGWIFGEE
jgi:FMN phosphatase YigB (HAD superfamily)